MLTYCARADLTRRRWSLLTSAPSPPLPPPTPQSANVRKKLKEGYTALQSKIDALDFDVEHAAEKELAQEEA